MENLEATTVAKEVFGEYMQGKEISPSTTLKELAIQMEIDPKEMTKISGFTKSTPIRQIHPNSVLAIAEKIGSKDKEQIDEGFPYFYGGSGKIEMYGPEKGTPMGARRLKR